MFNWSKGLLQFLPPLKWWVSLQHYYDNWVSTNGWGADYVSENKEYNTNRNMKQTIKLKESELKRLIAESVKGVINELDWKTYQNAAKKKHI